MLSLLPVLRQHQRYVLPKVSIRSQNPSSITHRFPSLKPLRNGVLDPPEYVTLEGDEGQPVALSAAQDFSIFRVFGPILFLVKFIDWNVYIVWSFGSSIWIGLFFGAKSPSNGALGHSFERIVLPWVIVDISHQIISNVGNFCMTNETLNLRRFQQTMYHHNRILFKMVFNTIFEFKGPFAISGAAEAGGSRQPGFEFVVAVENIITIGVLQKEGRYGGVVADLLTI